MHVLVQAVILGLLTGGVYALMASGQTLIFGIMKVVNLAQGALVILAAYLSYTLFGWLGLDPFLSVLLTTPLLFALGFGLGAATAASAGAVYGIVYPFNAGSHYDLISRLLTIVILGGLGSIGGAVVAAVLMGVVSSLVAALVSPAWSDFSFFAVLLVVLLVRPRGLFGASLRGAA